MAYPKKSKAERQRCKWGGGPFSAIPRVFAQSEVMAGLSPFACKLLFDLLAQYTGFNNGDFAITWSKMQGRGWNSKATLGKATNELLDKGIAIRTRRGGRRRCHLYALSIYDIDECKGKLDVPQTSKPPRLWVKNETFKPIAELQAEHRALQASRMTAH